MVRAALLSLALLPAAASGAGFFVNDGSTVGDVPFPGCASMPAGVDAPGCGTCANPCASAPYLVTATPPGPGDFIYVNAGRYLPPAGLKTAYLTFPVALSGTGGNPITVRGAIDLLGQPLAVFDGNATATAGVVIAANWVSLENLVITNLGCPNGFKSPFGSGVLVDPTPPGWVGISLVNLEIFGADCAIAAPIDFETPADPCTGCKIVGCHLHDNASSGGIYTLGATGLEIRDNRIFRNAVTRADYSAIVLHAGSNSVIEGNLISGVGGSALYLGDCGFASICGSRTTSNVRVANNTFWRNQVGTAGTSTGEIEIARATVGVVLENNIVGASRFACVGLDTSVTLATALASSDFNNFVPSPGAVVGALGGTTYPSLADWQTNSGKDTASVSVDPLFVSATDFHLASSAGRPAPDGGRDFDLLTSPLIDLGNPSTALGAEPAPNGGRVNLGAYGGTAQGSQTPVGLAIASGDGQNGPAGAALGLPLVVEVTQFDGGAASGVSVRFQAGDGAGSVNPPLALTNAAGQASTIATLASGGAHTFVAGLVGVFGAADVTFVANSQADAGSEDAGGTADAGSDAGSPLADAGTDAGALADAGVEPADAGADAGLEPADAGADAGFEPDGGMASDAGVDAGNTTADAGPSDEGRFAPTVGCGCGSTSGWPLGALAGLALWLRRRRHQYSE